MRIANFIQPHATEFTLGFIAVVGLLFILLMPHKHPNPEAEEHKQKKHTRITLSLSFTLAGTVLFTAMQVLTPIEYGEFIVSALWSTIVIVSLLMITDPEVNIAKGD
jgi:hypothetical protein